MRALVLGFASILLGMGLQGVLAERGMAAFDEYLQDGDTTALRAYLVALAHEALTQ